jgi:MFS family permease
MQSEPSKKQVMGWLWHSDLPFKPASFPFYYGWLILIVSTIGLVMSAPGQTIGVSVFTESLLDVTGLSRVQFSNAYLMGTLGSGLLLPYTGTVLDRIGVRKSVVASSIGLGAVLALLSQVDVMALQVSRLGPSKEIAAYALLTAGFLGLRFTGQGALTLTCRTMLGRWFERRRGLASSISAPFASVSFASSPLLLGGWVAGSGWRGAWQEMALLIGIGMAAFGWLFFREDPESCGLQMDGESPENSIEDLDPTGTALGDGATEADPTPTTRTQPATPSTSPIKSDATRAEALRSAGFWLITLGIANHAMVGTGIALHIVDLGAEAGLTEAAALRIFLPVTLISVPVGIVMGLAIDRFPMRGLIMAMMVGQCLMFGLAPHLADPLLYVLCIAGWGFSGGFYGPLTVAALPNFFGRTHLGAIQGVMMMVIVIASALGPALLAAGKTIFGSYEVILHALAGLPLILFVVAAFMRSPSPAQRRLSP